MSHRALDTLTPLQCGQEDADEHVCEALVTHGYFADGCGPGFACEAHLACYRGFARAKGIVHREWALKIPGVPEERSPYGW